MIRAEDGAVGEAASLTHTVASPDPNYNTQVISPVVTVNVTADDGGIDVDDGDIRVRVRVFLAGPLR